jgi:hypothetical protein
VNGALQQAQAVDPKWARKEHRRWLLLKLVAGGVILALGVGTVAFIASHKDAERITHIETKVEQSACQVDAAGTECQRAKRKAAKAESLSTACIPFHQTGYPCPKPGSQVAERATEGGDATSSPSTGHSQPSPGNGGGVEPVKGGSGHAPAPGKSGNHEAPAPGGGSGGAPAPTSSSSSQSSSSTTERVESTVVEKPATEAEQPRSSGLGGVTEGLGHTVEGLGETVEGVEGATCTLAKVLCSE